MGSFDELNSEPPQVMSLSVLLSDAIAFIQRYGWFVLALFIAVYVSFTRWQKQKKDKELNDPARLERLEEKRRQARLVQQSAWLAAAPAVYATEQSTKSKQQSSKLQRLYGEQKVNEDDNKADLKDILEGFVPAQSSGFKPYQKESAPCRKRGG